MQHAAWLAERRNQAAPRRGRSMELYTGAKPRAKVQVGLVLRTAQIQGQFKRFTVAQSWVGPVPPRVPSGARASRRARDSRVQRKRSSGSSRRAHGTCEWCCRFSVADGHCCWPACSARSWSNDGSDVGVTDPSPAKRRVSCVRPFDGLWGAQPRLTGGRGRRTREWR
jgi:hypothetical protein